MFIYRRDTGDTNLIYMYILAAQTNTSLLALTTLSLLIPAAFSASAAATKEIDSGIINLSHGTAIILLIVYGLYLVFQLKTHSALVRENFIFIT